MRLKKEIENMNQMVREAAALKKKYLGAVD